MITSKLYSVAHRVRRLPLLRDADTMWRAIRPMYHQVLHRTHKDGVPIELANGLIIRVPPELAAITEWDDYETPSLVRVAEWLSGHPGALLLDAGSSIGVFSVIALFASDSVDVIAFDSDLASLRVARRLCSCVARRRLTVIHGYLATEHTSGLAARQAGRSSDDRISSAPLESAIPEYKNLGARSDRDTADIPMHSLDGLFAQSYPAVPGNALLKIDCEGAELLILQGSQTLLREHQPQLLIAVHPEFIQRHGHSTEELKAFVLERGYSIDVLGTYYGGLEEHWWCTPQVESATETGSAATSAQQNPLFGSRSQGRST